MWKVKDCKDDFLEKTDKKVDSEDSSVGLTFFSHASKHPYTFPNKLLFLLVCSTSLLKTLGEKEIFLVTSNFSFSHSVFYPFGEFSAIYMKFKTGLQTLSVWKSKICVWKGLTLSQMTNFRLFQTKGLCSPQFQIKLNWQKVLQTGWKCGKRRNGLSRANSPFATLFSKNLYPWHIKTRVCLGNG